MKVPKLSLSPWVTLFIGYIIGYILYPVFQLWTCDCESYYRTRSDLTSYTLRLSKWMTIENGRLQSSLTREEFIADYLHPPTIEALGVSMAHKLKRLGSPQNLVEEYTVRKKLLVGVLTAGMYLQTRARAVYETWGQDVTQVVFFVGYDSNVTQPGLEGMNIVKLPGISDRVYPPQRKVFTMLKYMHDHYLDDFHWFMRADDDVYVRGEKLEAVLGRLDPNERVYLGRAGIGKPEDVKRLELLPHERYCMGGPGVVFSHASLQALAPHLDYCLSAVDSHNRHGNTAWFNEDVELGRCVSRTIDVQCSTSKEGRTYFIQDYESNALDPSRMWYDPSFKKLITVHPIKQPDNLYSLHHFYLTQKFQSLQQGLHNLQDRIARLCSMLPRRLEPPWQAMQTCTVKLCPQDGTNFTDSESLPFIPKLRLPTVNNPKNRYETKSWVHFDAVSNDDLYGILPRHQIFDGFWSEMAHLVTLLEGYVNYKSNKTLELHPVEVVDGYTRFSSEVGREYILDVKFAQVDNATNVEHKRVRLVRPLGQEILLVPERSVLDVTVNVVVPVTRVDHNFAQFMDAYQKASLHPQEKTHLIVTVLGEGQNLYHVQTLVTNYTRRYPKARVTILAGKGNSTVSGLELGMSVLTKGELAFLASANLRIQPGFFEACRRNTVAGERLYFPAPFLTYKEGAVTTKTATKYPNWLGHWATHSFIYTCLYKEDYLLLGGNLATPLFDRAIKEEIEVMRAPEHRLTQTLKRRSCDSLKDRGGREACFLSRVTSSVDQVELAQYLYDFRTLKHNSLKFDVL